MSSPRRQATAAVAAIVVVLASACAGGRGSGTARAPGPAEGATAVSTLTEDDFGTMRVARIEELLMGRVPGLTVLRSADGGYSLRIRGATSFVGNDEPLIVIDGMPSMGGRSSQALAHLNPADVARVEVLKDAGALATWGVQGGNGVIVITTRRR
jgi:TonB-dependent SusC/RagA subfamily outer membrane receptor